MFEEDDNDHDENVDHGDKDDHDDLDHGAHDDHAEGYWVRIQN